MKHLLLIVTLATLSACGGDDADNAKTRSDTSEATELRDWAKSHTSRAELTAQLAEAKMALRLVEQTDPGSSEADKLKAEIEKLENELEELKNDARQ